MGFVSLGFGCSQTVLLAILWPVLSSLYFVRTHDRAAVVPLLLSIVHLTIVAWIIWCAW